MLTKRVQSLSTSLTIAISTLAAELKAEHLIFISDVAGVIINGSVKNRLRCSEIDKFIEEKQITGGMIPKLKSAADVISRGAKRVHICNWYGKKTVANELSQSNATGTVLL
jgi:acetylglutamate kinase